jgi:signal peptidase I
MHREGVLGYGTYPTASVSMLPTLEKNDLLMVNTWRYKSRSQKDGEIVILDEPGEPGVTVVRRVVGVAGDSVELRDGVLLRNGQAVTEPYLHPATANYGDGRDYPALSVRADEVFVLGDYRDNSLDSRRWGLIPTSQLRGRAEYIWFSAAAGKLRWDRIGKSLAP